MRNYRPIRDYAIIGDGHTAALVARDGSIDWCCWPNFDSGAVFCRLLDAERGGWFSVGPAGRHSATRAYAKDSNLLLTTFHANGGTFRVTDLMPIERRRLTILRGVSDLVSPAGGEAYGKLEVFADGTAVVMRRLLKLLPRLIGLTARAR